MTRINWKEIAGKLAEFVSHERDCIIARWEEGQPTADGGYRSKFAGKWYQYSPIDQTPKCDCGLDKIYALYTDALKMEEKEG